MSAERPSPVRAPTDRVAAELSVFVACHTFVCALPALAVERLLLRDEASIEGAREASTLGGSRVARVAGRRLAAWDIGELLGLGPVDAAWVLLQIAAPEGPITVALRSGPCLVVERLGAIAAVPPGVFRARRGAIRGVFSASPGGRDETVGLALDPARLLTADEIARASAVAAAPARAGARA